MSVASSPPEAAIFGGREHLDVSRALCELQARRPVRGSTPDESLIALPVEGLDDRRLREFAMLCDPVMPKLIVTQQRARAIGIETSTPMALSLPATIGANDIFELAAGARNHIAVEAEPASNAATAAIRLVKLARGLPAILTAHIAAIGGDMIQPVSVVEAGAINRFVEDATNSLAFVSEASVPLASGTSARFVVFRDALGVAQVAIVVGKPDLSAPVPVLRRSAGLAGGVFGGRRWACGGRRRLAVARRRGRGGGARLAAAGWRARYPRRRRGARLRGR